MQKYIQTLIIIALFTLLTACGFHLRGEEALPPQLRVLYLKSNNPYGEFEHELKKAMQQVGIAVVNSPEDANYTLEISQTNLNYIPSSVGTSSQATVYNVTYVATIQLTDAHGKIIIPQQDVRSTSTMIVNAQQALSSTNQIDVLAQQLRRETIIKIFNILTSCQAHLADASSIYAPSPQPSPARGRGRRANHVGHAVEYSPSSVPYRAPFSLSRVPTGEG